MEKITEKTMQVPMLLQTLRNYNIQDSRFSKVKIWLMHLGENLNGSVFTEEAVTRALPTLVNTPIMGYFNSNSNDFEGHEIDLIEEDETLKLKNTTVPYGVIPEFNQAQFEDRVGDDGVTRTYLTVVGLLWNKWEDAISVINSKGGLTGQSMEITDFDGKFTEDDLFEFTDFKFDGACLLGDAVQPAMSNSTVEIAFSNKTSEIIIQEKLATFTKSTNEGGLSLEKDKFEEDIEELPEEPETDPEVDTEEPVEPEPPVEPEVEPEEPEVEPEEPVVTTETESVQENTVGYETETRSTKELLVGEEQVEIEGVDGFDEVEYEITFHDGEEHSRKEIGRKTTPPVTKVVLVGARVEDKVITEESLSDARAASKEHDEQVISPAVDRITIGENVYTLQEVTEIVENHFALLEKLHKEEIDEIFAKHSGDLTEDEVAEVKNSAYEKTVDEVETAIYAIIGRKAFSSQSDKSAKSSFSSVAINTKAVSEPYGGILSKYKK